MFPNKKTSNRREVENCGLETHLRSPAQRRDLLFFLRKLRCHLPVPPGLTRHSRGWALDHLLKHLRHLFPPGVLAFTLGKTKTKSFFQQKFDTSWSPIKRFLDVFLAYNRERVGGGSQVFPQGPWLRTSAKTICKSLAVTRPSFRQSRPPLLIHWNVWGIENTIIIPGNSRRLVFNRNMPACHTGHFLSKNTQNMPWKNVQIRFPWTFVF